MKIFAKIWLILLLSVELAAGTFLSTAASAQMPTPNDIDRMLSSMPPEDMKLMPYYKWADGAPIDVLIVTGKQRSQCVDIAMEQIKHEVSLIRESVPQLRNIRTPRTVNWIPEEKLRAPLLIGLGMPHPTIQEAMKWYARFNAPRARIWDEDRYFNFLSVGNGFSVEKERIVQAYYWTMDPNGFQYSEKTCRESGWTTGQLYSLLGSPHFVPGNSRWLQDMKDNEQRERWSNLANRLFLKALYACPSSPATLACTKPMFARLVADPGLVPWR